MRKDKGVKEGEGGEKSKRKYEGSLPCMAASSTDRLPPTDCTIAIVSTFFAPPPAYLSAPRILHLQGGVTLKTLPVLNYPVPLSLFLSLFLPHFFHSSPATSLQGFFTILSALFSRTVGLSSPKNARLLKFAGQQIGPLVRKKPVLAVMKFWKNAKGNSF